MEHIKDVVKRAMAIVHLRGKTGHKSLDDHVYDVLNEGSEAFAVMGMDQQGDLIGEVVKNLIDHLEDHRILALATVIMERNK